METILDQTTTLNPTRKHTLRYINEEMRETTLTLESFSAKEDKLDIYTYYLRNAQLSNIRLGNAHTKGRSQKAGSGRKIKKQKHTGTARQGMNRAPHRKGSGKVFGPTSDKNYQKKLNKKFLARTLSSYLTNCTMTVIDSFEKIDNMKSAQNFFKQFDKKVLLVANLHDNLQFIRNLDKTRLAMSFVEFHFFDFVWRKDNSIVMTKGALNHIIYLINEVYAKSNPYLKLQLTYDEK